MKLIRFKLNSQGGFRSLPEGFEIHFLRDFHHDEATEFNPYVLAGLNGSGKSNILEVLAEIFYHLDCMFLSKRPDYFDATEENPKGFNPESSLIEAYELEYFTFLDSETFSDLDVSKKAEIHITKKAQERPKINWVNQEAFRKVKELSRAESKALLPEFVVGYASGLNQTLSLPFFKSRFLQYDAYLENLKTGEYVAPRPESSLVFLDNTFSQAILLSNLLMNNLEDENSVLGPFKNYVKLLDIESFRLIIKTSVKAEIHSEITYEDGIPNNGNEIRKYNIFESLRGVDGSRKNYTQSYLEKLKRCATAYSEKSFLENEVYDSELTFEADETKYLYLDYLVNDATKEAFQLHFDNDPLKLFELFQLLLIFNNYEFSIQEKHATLGSKNIFLVNDMQRHPKENDRVLRFKDLYIKKEGVANSIYTKNLSDGEHQFLHTLGLCLLFKDTRSLFLLDEPETHFNPDWKAKYISSIRNSFKKEELDSTQTMREMLITTHSPFLISDSEMQYVLLFEKDEQTRKVKEVLRPDFQTFGTSVNKIGIRLFAMPNTIGEFAQAKVTEFREKSSNLRNNEEKEDLIKKIKESLGESVERTLLIHEILESMDDESPNPMPA